MVKRNEAKGNEAKRIDTTELESASPSGLAFAGRIYEAQQEVFKAACASLYALKGKIPSFAPNTDKPGFAFAGVPYTVGSQFRLMRFEGKPKLLTVLFIVAENEEARGDEYEGYVLHTGWMFDETGAVFAEAPGSDSGGGYLPTLKSTGQKLPDDFAMMFTAIG